MEEGQLPLLKAVKTAILHCNSVYFNFAENSHTQKRCLEKKYFFPSLATLPSCTNEREKNMD